MKISGAAIVRNGIKFGYPFIESIRSILPLVDEFVIGVGDSEDETHKKIEDIGNPKIRIIDTVWDTSNRTGGTILSVQTNLVLDQCRGDWIFYLQSDEVVHEEDFDIIRNTLKIIDSDKSIDGISFNWLHFYGSYYTVQSGRNWYKKEVRLIRNDKTIRSFGDAQGFRKNGNKLSAKVSNARIFHYGWARSPVIMVEKIKSFHKFWHDDAWIETNCSGKQERDFFSDIGNLKTYSGTHPLVMSSLISKNDLAFINGVKREYIKRRGLIDLARDFFRSLPFGQHINFKPVK